MVRWQPSAYSRQMTQLILVKHSVPAAKLHTEPNHKMIEYITLHSYLTMVSNYNNKKAVLTQGNCAMPQLFFLV